MKKILLINQTNTSSTGKICEYLLGANKENYDVYFAIGKPEKPLREREYSFQTNKFVEFFEHIAVRANGGEGFHNLYSTTKLIKIIKTIKPDLVNIHNIHDYVVNLPMLLNYLNFVGIPVVMTMHDCWNFTGRCANFDFNHCNKWGPSERCFQCKFRQENPKSILFSRTHHFWKKKNRLFSSNPNIVFVSPSKWLADLARQSMLKNHRIVVINNGVDAPEQKNDHAAIQKDGRKIILAAASELTVRKGVNDMIRISQILDNTKYRLILAGKASIDFSEHKNVEYVGELSNAALMALMGNSDVLINPTYQDNFPTVNIEAMSLGVPIVAYETGGCPEVVKNDVGRVVPSGDYKLMYEAVKEVLSGKSLKENCIKESKKYTVDKMVDKYFDLFKEVLDK